MSRLTGHDDKYVYIRGCLKRYTNVERKGANHANAIVRLAAYEDTGLTPDEVNGLRTTLTELRGEVDGILDKQKLMQVLKERGLPMDDGIQHIEDLLQAEQNGRLVVLPNEKVMLDCCPMRIEQNGNCSPIGGFCKPDTEICKALHAAYEAGAFNARAQAAPAVALPPNEPLTVDELREMEVDIPILDRAQQAQV